MTYFVTYTEYSVLWGTTHQKIEQFDELDDKTTEKFAKWATATGFPLRDDITVYRAEKVVTYIESPTAVKREDAGTPNIRSDLGEVYLRNVAAIADEGRRRENAKRDLPANDTPNLNLQYHHKFWASVAEQLERTQRTPLSVFSDAFANYLDAAKKLLESEGFVVTDPAE